MVKEILPPPPFQRLIDRISPQYAGIKLLYVAGSDKSHRNVLSIPKSQCAN